MVLTPIVSIHIMMLIDITESSVLLTRPMRNTTITGYVRTSLILKILLPSSAYVCPPIFAVDARARYIT